MPGSQTTPGRPGARDNAPARVAFRHIEQRRHPGYWTFAAQWLACTLPCRRFADILADACARLGADVDRYSFIVMDLHHLLLAGLPAHIAVGTPITGRPPHRTERARIRALGSHLGCLTAKRSLGQG